MLQRRAQPLFCYLYLCTLRGSTCRGARAVRDPFIQSQSGGMVTPQSPPGTNYNSSPGRPSPGESVQIPDAVRARCGYFPKLPSWLCTQQYLLALRSADCTHGQIHSYSHVHGLVKPTATIMHTPVRTGTDTGTGTGTGTGTVRDTVTSRGHRAKFFCAAQMFDAFFCCARFLVPTLCQLDKGPSCVICIPGFSCFLPTLRGE